MWKSRSFFFILGMIFLGSSTANAGASLRIGPAFNNAAIRSLRAVELIQEPQLRSRIRLSDLEPKADPVGPKAPKDILRTQRNILRHDRVSYGFYGESGSRIEDFVFRHADESTSLQIE